MTECVTTFATRTEALPVGEHFRKDRRLWAAAALAGCLLVRLVAETLPSWYATGENSHGFVVLPLVVYLLWQRRKELAQLPVAPTRGASVFSLLALLSLAFGIQSGLVSFSRPGVPLLLLATALGLVGKYFVGRTVGAFVLLFFLIPLPRFILQEVSVPLRLAVTTLTCHAGALAGIPARAQGTAVLLPEGALRIEQPCSGLRGMIALELFAVFFGEIRNLSLLRRLGLAALAPFCAFLLNLLRVTATVIAAFLFGIPTASSLHTATGLVVIAVGAIALSYLAGRGKTCSAGRWCSARRGTRRSSRVALPCLLLANTLLWGFPHGVKRNAARFQVQVLPLELGDFHGKRMQLSPAAQQSLGASETVWLRYRRSEEPGATYELLCAFYRVQEPGKQPHDPLLCLLGSGWRLQHPWTVVLPVVDPGTGEHVSATLTRATYRTWSLSTLSLHIGPRKTYPGSEAAKPDRLWESVTLLRTDALSVRLSVRRKGPPHLAGLCAFAERILPFLYKAYEGRRGR